MARGLGHRATDPGGESTAAREAVERRWFRRQKHELELGGLVTATSLREEPYHRWLGYKQAFAPALVRLFLDEVGRDADAPLLDPFSGSGTFAIECARREVPAIGIEAIPSLAFLAESRGVREFPPLPDLSDQETWQEMAEQLSEPIHRAALICAVARRHSSDGKPLREPAPLGTEVAAVVEMMREDLNSPLTGPVDVRVGDARDLQGVADESIGGILTSPPYLTRHDYTKLTRAHEEVFRYWHPATTQTELRGKQVRAHPKAHRREWRYATQPAADEACDALRQRGERKLAGIVRSYFEDLTAALGEFARVLRNGGVCWLVLGGARLKDVYVPSDSIAATIADECGLDVLELRVARRLISTGRNLGGLTDVSPRETVIVLQRSRRSTG